MKVDNLLTIKGVVINKGLKLPDITLSSGDILWLQTDNNLQADVFSTPKGRMLENVIFSNLTKDKSNNVTFNVEFDVDPDLLSYSKNITNGSLKANNTDTINNSQTIDQTQPLQQVNTNPQ